ncbi:His/Gly/Thr/Pro-type tRNA ligase C-terminal domain-containing protein [Bacillaceae bacterium S4-13-56]
MQGKILPIAESHVGHAYNVQRELMSQGIRVEVDDRSEKVGLKIREADMQKIPYMMVIGDKEIKNNSIAVRRRKKGNRREMNVDQLVEEF